MADKKVLDPLEDLVNDQEYYDTIDARKLHQKLGNLLHQHKNLVGRPVVVVEKEEPGDTYNVRFMQERDETWEEKQARSKQALWHEQKQWDAYQELAKKWEGKPRPE
jgi:hypothetical protein